VERQIAERARAQAQRELEAAVEREKLASRYKSEFLASMSHELRTPMTAIRGYAELLARPDAERALQDAWVRNLRRSTEYLLALVHDVLDLSKIEAGRLQLARERTDLAEALGALEDLFSGYAREKGLALEIAIDGELPQTLESDPVRLRQILVNLTGNALKFTHQGSVAVRARAFTTGDARMLEIRVTDTGPGIPAEALGRLFQPFSQIHRSTGGTGLGLQIARSLARLLGGDVTVESREGAGSTFTLTLPAAGVSGSLRALPTRGAGKGDAQRPLPTPPELAGKRILVVDDSPENREVLAYLLRAAGAQCEVERNGQSGVARALTATRVGAPFDAILMDMNMPVMDGFEAARKLVGEGVTTPVIALTALVMAGDEERCREAGCADYIAKPVMPALLLDTLARHLRLAAPGAAQEGSTAPVESPESGPARAGHVISLAQHPRFRGLVERYVASFPELVQELRARASAGQLDEVRTLAHRLRGTAASYGFAALAEAAGRCEDAIRAGAPPAEIARALEDVVGRLTLARAG
jgi:CheY-like chemotaxis protein/nitrogen-specific signal transduction histidine kinase/HPt (histidine-containing phosphotransfer) domain-containing protein